MGVNNIVKRKIRGVSDNGYFQYKGYVEKSDSDILSIFKYDGSVNKILLRYYPLMKNKDIVLLDSIGTYRSVRSLTNNLNTALERLIRGSMSGFNVNINDVEFTLEVTDLDGNLLYVMRV